MRVCAQVLRAAALHPHEAEDERRGGAEGRRPRGRRPLDVGCQCTQTENGLDVASKKGEGSVRWSIRISRAVKMRSLLVVSSGGKRRRCVCCTAVSTTPRVSIPPRAYVENKAGLTGQTFPGRRIILGHWPYPAPEELAETEPGTQD